MAAWNVRFSRIGIPYPAEPARIASETVPLIGPIPAKTGGSAQPVIAHGLTPGGTVRRIIVLRRPKPNTRVTSRKLATRYFAVWAKGEVKDAEWARCEM